MQIRGARLIENLEFSTNLLHEQYRLLVGQARQHAEGPVVECFDK